VPEGVAGGVASFRVALSYLEVYNENIYDLLSDAPGSKQGDSPPPSLDLREGPEGVLVAGLTRFEASSANDVLELLHQGNQRRQTEQTRCNETSSRSHAVLQVFIETEGADGNVRCGKLSLVDLAGSERHIATERRSQRSQEGTSINRSLLALSGCINALVQAQRHVPFRNSKLTQILKDSLAGRCQTSMIANITPSHQCIGETANTLHWAARAKQIRIAPEAVRSRCFEKATAINRRASTSAVGAPPANGRPTTRSMTTRSMARKTGRVSCVPVPTRNLDKVQARVRTGRPSTAGPVRRDSTAPRRVTRPSTARTRVARPGASAPAAAAEIRQMRERMEALESSMVEMRRMTTERETAYRTNMESVLQEKDAVLRQKDELIGMLLKLGCASGGTPEKRAALESITNQVSAVMASPGMEGISEGPAEAIRKVVTPDPRSGQENGSPALTGEITF